MIVSILIVGSIIFTVSLRSATIESYSNRKHRLTITGDARRWNRSIRCKSSVSSRDEIKDKKRTNLVSSIQKECSLVVDSPIVGTLCFVNKLSNINLAGSRVQRCIHRWIHRERERTLANINYGLFEFLIYTFETPSYRRRWNSRSGA